MEYDSEEIKIKVILESPPLTEGIGILKITLLMEDILRVRSLPKRLKMLTNPI